MVGQQYVGMMEKWVDRFGRTQGFKDIAACHIGTHPGVAARRGKSQKDGLSVTEIASIAGHEESMAAGWEPWNRCFAQTRIGLFVGRGYAPDDAATIIHVGRGYVPDVAATVKRVGRGYVPDDGAPQPSRRARRRDLR